MEAETDVLDRRDMFTDNSNAADGKNDSLSPNLRTCSSTTYACGNGKPGP